MFHRLLPVDWKGDLKELRWALTPERTNCTTKKAFFNSTKTHVREIERIICIFSMKTTCK